MITVDEAALVVIPTPPLPPTPRTPSTVRRNNYAPLASVVAVSLFANVWGLNHNGFGNQYYSAAARSMSLSWHNWFFAAFDPGGFISVDKPPVPLWITAVSVRLFGVSTWSLILPSAFAGTAAVAVLWCIVRRRFGVVAATIAGFVLAVSPINVAVNRLNLPEPWMLLFLLGAAWAVMRSFDSPRWIRWLTVAGILIGLAFNTKMLAACIPLPAVAIGVLLASTSWRERVKRGAVLAATSLVTSVAWLAIVDAVPENSRPYVGGSTNNTVRDLVFGYNGFNRINGGFSGGGGRGPGGGGRGPGGGGPGGAMSGLGGIFGGRAGPFRLFSEALAPQISWLLPLALVSVIAAMWLHRGHRRQRAEVTMWFVWLLLYGYIFSTAKGTFHSYYTATMGPAVAALVGIGVAALVPLIRRDRLWLAAAGLALVTTAALQWVISRRVHGFYSWTGWPMLAGCTGSVVWLAANKFTKKGVLIGGAIALGGLLFTPVAWSLSETNNSVLNSTLPQAGPRVGVAGSSFGSKSWNGDPELAAFLRSQHNNETWDVFVANAQQGSGLIADEGISVLAPGGFMGTDASTTVAKVADLVAGGQVRFFMTNSGGFGGFGGSNANQIVNAARRACTALTTQNSSVPANYSGSIYDCAGKADSLRSA